MTVIAWDGTTLAADRQATVGARTYTVCKLRRIDADRIAGVSGHLGHGEALVEWLRSGGDPERYPKAPDDCDAYLIVVHRCGRVVRYENNPWPIDVSDQFHATGSGADFAIAALACGKSAVEAVQIACQWSADCGNGIDTLTFGGA